MTLTPFTILVCIAILLSVASFIWPNLYLVSTAVLLLAVALLIRA